MITIHTRPAAIATCAVCARADVRVKANGKLYNHGVGQSAPIAAIHPGCAYADFKLCLGSGRVVGK